MTPSSLCEHDVVAVLADVPQEGLTAGDTGTIVHCYDDGQAYEVEFLDAAGRTQAIVTLEGAQLLKLKLAPATAS